MALCILSCWFGRICSSFSSAISSLSRLVEGSIQFLLFTPAFLTPARWLTGKACLWVECCTHSRLLASLKPFTSATVCRSDASKQYFARPRGSDSSYAERSKVFVYHLLPFSHGRRCVCQEVPADLALQASSCKHQPFASLSYLVQSCQWNKVKKAVVCERALSCLFFFFWL